MEKELNMANTKNETVVNRAFDLGGKYLTFFLGSEEYALEILKVVEIVGFIPPTPIPQTPDFILGLINLRGKILPIMDLRSKFNMTNQEQNEETVIIDVQVRGVEMGIVVDKVSEVIDIPGDSIEEAPDFGTNLTTDFILGIGKTEKNVKILLNIDKVLTKEELKSVEKMAQNTKQEQAAA